MKEKLQGMRAYFKSGEEADKWIKRSKTVNTSENVTGALGVMAGIDYGAILGTSVMPGIGIVGSIVGGMLGNTVSRSRTSGG